MKNYKTIEELQGKTLVSIEDSADEIVFLTSTGEQYHMYHQQDCCESVNITNIEGELKNLIGKPIVRAREEIGHEEQDPDGWGESVTLTNFVLQTETHEVVIHWRGSSNGYYSETVYFVQL